MVKHGISISKRGRFGKKWLFYGNQIVQMIIICFLIISCFFVCKNTESRANKGMFLISGGCINENSANTRSYTQISISVSDCFFVRSLQYSGSGSVIYVNGGTLSMFISSTTFYSCSCSSYGGAIFFISSNSDIKKICAHRCSASSYNHFAYLQGSQDNFVEFLSISYCSPSLSGYTSVCLSGGNQKVFNTNSSMNNANQVSGILNSNLLTHISSFCVFSNDISSNSKCIFYENDPGTISYTNFVHNTSPSLGVIHVSGGSPKMEYCVFNSNQDILFS